MAKVGRPSKLTEELTTQICDLLRDGNFVETVCDFVGINKTTIYEWIARGERGWKADVEGGYVEFTNVVKKAMSQVEFDTLKDLRQGVDNWQARAWWLERRHPDKWGNRGKSTFEHQGEGGGPVVIKVVYEDEAK